MAETVADLAFGPNKADNAGYFANIAKNTFGTLLNDSPLPTFHYPALRALVRNAYPTTSAHKQSQIVDMLGQNVGDLFTGGQAELNKVSIGATPGEYAHYASRKPQEYSQLVRRIGEGDTFKRYARIAKNLVDRVSIEGSEGYASFPMVEGKAGGRVEPLPGYTGKITLAAKFIQPGTDVTDTTIPKKVESEVSADYFSYLAANPERGIYNAMYLNEVQWLKDIRWGGDLALPRRGNDQQYFRSMELAPENQSMQPVEQELMNKFTDGVYAIYASHDQNWDPLKDKRETVDSIMGRKYDSHFFCENSLQADGVWPYPDPDRWYSSADVNFLGFRPPYDSYTQPNDPSRFNPVFKTLSPQDQLRSNMEAGFSSWQLPLSNNTFPKRIDY